MPNINDLAREAQNDPRIALVDVRTPAEYRAGHIAGSILVESEKAYTILHRILDHDTVLYVYCRSGRRSEAASTVFRRLGYRSVRNIGGILSWNGPLEIGSEN